MYMYGIGIRTYIFLVFMQVNIPVPWIPWCWWPPPICGWVFNLDFKEEGKSSNRNHSFLTSWWFPTHLEKSSNWVISPQIWENITNMLKFHHLDLLRLCSDDLSDPGIRGQPGIWQRWSISRVIFGTWRWKKHMEHSFCLGSTGV